MPRFRETSNHAGTNTFLGWTGIGSTSPEKNGHVILGFLYLVIEGNGVTPVIDSDLERSSVVSKMSARKAVKPARLGKNMPDKR